MKHGAFLKEEKSACHVQAAENRTAKSVLNRLAVSQAVKTLYKPLAYRYHQHLSHFKNFLNRLDLHRPRTSLNIIVPHLISGSSALRILLVPFFRILPTTIHHPRTSW